MSKHAEREETRCKMCGKVAYVFMHPFQIVCTGCGFDEEDCACRE